MQEANLVFELRNRQLIGGPHLLDAGGDFGGGSADGAANLLDVVAHGALVQIVQFSLEAGFEIDFAFGDGAGE